MLISNFPGGGVNVKDATATPSDVLAGKTFYSGNKNKKTGTIPSKGAQTYTPGTANQTIAAGQYLSGAQTVSGSANLVPGNIKNAVNIFGVVGNYTGFPSAVSAGDTLIKLAQVEFALTWNNAVYYDALPNTLRFTCVKPGTYRFATRCYKFGSSYAYFRLHKNGSYFNNYNFTTYGSGNYMVTVTYDLSLAAGDQIKWWAYGGDQTHWMDIYWRILAPDVQTEMNKYISQG